MGGFRLVSSLNSDLHKKFFPCGFAVCGFRLRFKRRVTVFVYLHFANDFVTWY